MRKLLKWIEEWEARVTPGHESYYAAKRSERRRNSPTVNYSADERRVAKYISRITHGAVGAGDDPIGFLIACHAGQATIRHKSA